MLLSDQYQALAVYFNLLHLTYNTHGNKNNLGNNWLCNHLPDPSQCYVIVCSHIISYWLIKKVSSIDNNISIFYFYFRKKYPLYAFLSLLFPNDKTNNDKTIKS